MGNTGTKIFRAVTKAAAWAAAAVVTSVAAVGAITLLPIAAPVLTAVTIGGTVAGWVGAAAGLIGGGVTGYQQCVECNYNPLSAGRPGECNSCDRCKEHCTCK
ncbi:hypothetical protein Ddc_14771 [Ditylenchus destructor]|nr:hypothetical protein Ddc_14771 [Ditylenchus destructor]